MNLQAIKCCCFDINETMFPAAAAKPVFEEYGIPLPNLKTWFAEVLRDAFATQLAGDFVPFREFAGFHFGRHGRQVGQHVNEAEAAEKLAAAWENAEPFPDIRPGILMLQEAGIKIAAMTNGTVKIAYSIFKKSGVINGSVFDINESKAWKPSPDAYNFVCNALLLSKHEVLMIACHPWDVHGALAAGLQAAYIQRNVSEGMYPKYLRQPVLQGQGLDEVAAALLTAKLGVDV